MMRRKNLISCRVPDQCLLLTNSCISECDIRFRGQYIKSQSTGDDLIFLTVAVFLSEQLKVV